MNPLVKALEDIDFTLSQMEDYFHGAEGMKITKMRKVISDAISLYSQSKEGEDEIDFKLLEEYDMREHISKTIHHVLTKTPEENREQFLINLCNGMVGSAILHHNNRHVKKLIVPDFKTTFK